MVDGGDSTLKKADLLQKLRANIRPSPFYPTMYFASAISGGASSGTSVLAALSSHVWDGQDNRKFVRELLLSQTKTKQDMKKTLRSKPMAALSKAIPKKFHGLVLVPSNLRYFRASDECAQVNYVIRAANLEGFEVAGAAKYNDEIASIEKLVFTDRRTDHEQACMAYLMIPYDEFKNYVNSSDESDEKSMRCILSFLDIVKVQNLYCDLCGRLGMAFKCFSFIEDSSLGSYTRDFFEQRKSDSQIGNWSEFCREYQKRHDIDLDVKSLRDQRKGSHRITQSILRKYLSLLSCEEEYCFGYYLAYCFDWHYRNLNPELKKMLNRVSFSERLATAQSRWDSHILPLLPKSSPT